MLRRTGLPLKMGMFTKLRDGYDPKKLKLKDATTGRGTNLPMGDPVLNAHNLNETIQPIRRSNRQINNHDDFFQSHETEKWMNIKDAAIMLKIPVDKLVGLKPSDVETAWVKGYKDANFGGKKNEATYAAEVLLEYIDSELHAKKTSDYYRKTIENMRLDVDRELSAQRDWYWEVIMQGMGGFFFIGACIIMFMIYLSHVMSRDNFSHMLSNVNSFLNVSFLRPTNVEPPPDYINRYRDTPTALDVDKANGIDLSNEDGSSLAITYAMKAYQDGEDEYLVQLMNEENLIAIKEAKLEKARNSTWIVDHTGNNEGDKEEGQTMQPSLLKRISESIGGSTSQTEPAKRTKSTFEVNFHEFTDYFYTNMPSFQRGRAGNVLDRAKEQDEAVQRVEQRKLREEKEGLE
eukprot:Tbor_TRINITY_DN2701_c0_g1::TRINITY_DN2701_c0_g1_i1::g.15238::m.15238